MVFFWLGLGCRGLMEFMSVGIGGRLDISDRFGKARYGVLAMWDSQATRLNRYAINASHYANSPFRSFIIFMI